MSDNNSHLCATCHPGVGTWRGAHRKAATEHFARIARARELGMTEYEYCPERDAEHDPMPAQISDPDNVRAGYFTVECRACGQTTGVPMPAAEAVEWD